MSLPIFLFLFLSIKGSRIMKTNSLSHRVWWTASWELVQEQHPWWRTTEHTHMGGLVKVNNAEVFCWRYSINVSFTGFVCFSAFFLLLSHKGWVSIHIYSDKFTCLYMNPKYFAFIKLISLMFFVSPKYHLWVLIFKLTF